MPGYKSISGSDNLFDEPEAKITYKRADRDGNESAEGMYCLFGSYPQQCITDKALISELNKLVGRLPDTKSSGEWQSYNSYYGDGTEGSERIAPPFMWYNDISLGGELYRGIYFTHYKRGCTYSMLDKSPQGGYSFRKRTVHWFKFSPILWRIEQIKADRLYLVSDKLLDSGAYHDLVFGLCACDENREVIRNEQQEVVLASSYEHSTVRRFLNEKLYITAFSAEDTDAIIPCEGICANCTERIFLPSRDEVWEYSTPLDIMSSDYAKCRGIHGQLKTEPSLWWLRTPDKLGVMAVLNDSKTEDINANHTYLGIRPALWVRLIK